MAWKNALMDYVFNGLATTPPEPSGLVDEAVRAVGAAVAGRGFARLNRDERPARVMAAGRGRPMTLLPDLLIVFAVCRLAGEEEERRAERERRQLETQAQPMELENWTADRGRR